MYMNVEYASWLNATYGLSESIRELVPIRNVPPVFPPELAPPQPASITTRISATQVFFITPPEVQALNAGSSTVRLRASASSVQRTPSGREARCFP